MLCTHPITSVVTQATKKMEVNLTFRCFPSLGSPCAWMIFAMMWPFNNESISMCEPWTAVLALVDTDRSWAQFKLSLTGGLSVEHWYSIFAAFLGPVNIHDNMLYLSTSLHLNKHMYRHMQLTQLVQLVVLVIAYCVYIGFLPNEISLALHLIHPYWKLPSSVHIWHPALLRSKHSRSLTRPIMCQTFVVMVTDDDDGVRGKHWGLVTLANTDCQFNSATFPPHSSASFLCTSQHADTTIDIRQQ